MRIPAGSGITTTLAWTLLNSGIALFGYYFSAWLIDDINWGRYRIQVSLGHMVVFATCWWGCLSIKYCVPCMAIERAHECWWISNNRCCLPERAPACVLLSFALLR